MIPLNLILTYLVLLFMIYLYIMNIYNFYIMNFNIISDMVKYYYGIIIILLYFIIKNKQLIPIQKLYMIIYIIGFYIIYDLLFSNDVINSLIMNISIFHLMFNFVTIIFIVKNYI